VTRWWDWWRWVVGVGLLVLLVTFIGANELLEIFRRASAIWIVVIVGLSFAWLFLGAFNVWLLLRRLTAVRLGTFLGVYVTSWATSLVLPGQLGDASQVLLLRRHGVPAASSSAAYLADKIISLSWLVVVAAYGVGRYTTSVTGYVLVAFPLVVIVGAVVGSALLLRTPLKLGRVLDRGREVIRRVAEQLMIFRRHLGTVVLNVSLTLVKWVLMASLYLAAFHAVGTTVTFEAAATIPVMSSLVGYIPVTVGGAGTMEWTAVVLFRRVGLEGAVVLSAYILLRVVLILGALALLAAARDRIDKETAG
jgi:uncharacterized protein (TIRG00374 family)